MSAFLFEFLLKYINIPTPIIITPITVNIIPIHKAASRAVLFLIIVFGTPRTNPIIPRIKTPIPMSKYFQ